MDLPDLDVNGLDLGLGLKTGSPDTSSIPVGSPAQGTSGIHIQNAAANIPATSTPDRNTTT
ncbi:hypothetical protein NGM37_31275, partial [Streptomyces sp. TRM76130]|nr:hypothetical protein [Streptomyces sp. TRM76130]